MKSEFIYHQVGESSSFKNLIVKYPYNLSKYVNIRFLVSLPTNVVL